MSIKNTIAKLAPILSAITAPGQPAVGRVYTDPAEALSMADFPCFVITLAGGNQVHNIEMQAQGLARHSYTLVIYLMVGSRQSGRGIPEMHSRVLDWIWPIAVALFANITLGGSVAWIGPGANNTLFDYTIGQIPWADETFFGARIMLPVVEKLPVNIAG